MEEKKIKILIIVPAYNEEANIEWVIKELQRDIPQYDYIVVNDGSIDETASICKREGFSLLDLPVNIGLTGAVVAGMRYAIQKGYDAVVQYDGDGQHRPEYVPILAEQLKKGNDIVIGSRYLEKKKPLSFRMLGSRIISAAINLRTGKHITDPTSGMRMYGKKAMNNYVTDINCGPEPDTISYLISKGLNVEEVHVEMRDRVAGSSYLNVMRSMNYMINMIVSIVVIQGIRKKGEN